VPPAARHHEPGTTRRSQPYRLKINEILEADPGIAAGHAGMHAGSAGHDLTPSGPPRRATITLTLDALIHAAGTDEEVNQAVGDHLRVTSADDAVAQVTYEAEPAVENA